MRTTIGAVAFLLGTVGTLRADDFREKVAPIFESKCLRCHGETARRGNLALHTAKSTFDGGMNGAVVVPGKPDDSPLLKVVSGPKPTMPKGSPPLSAEQVGAIRAWITAGAVWPDGITLNDPDAPFIPPWVVEKLQALAAPAVAIAAAVLAIVLTVVKRLRAKRSQP